MFITKFLKLSHIVWQMPDDDTVSLDGHIALFASIINYRMTLKGTGKSLEKTISYVKWKTNKVLKKIDLSKSPSPLKGGVKKLNMNVNVNVNGNR